MAAILTGALVYVVATRSCAVPTASDPCPDAAINRAVVIGLAALTLALLVAPFAFLAEYALRRRIVYRGAWVRAGRRAALAAGVLAAVAGLRLGGALSVWVAAFLLVLVLAEGQLTRRELRG